MISDKLLHKKYLLLSIRAIAIPLTHTKTRMHLNKKVFLSLMRSINTLQWILLDIETITQM